MKRLKLLFLGLVLLSVTAGAENLVIEKISHDELHHAIETIGRLEFDLHNGEENVAPDLLLIAKDGSVLATVSVDEVKKVYFSEATALDQLENQLTVVADQSGETLTVEGAKDNTLRVFDMNGKLMLTQIGQTINVGSLPKGVYLLQCGMSVVKFTK